MIAAQNSKHFDDISSKSFAVVLFVRIVAVIALSFDLNCALYCVHCALCIVLVGGNNQHNDNDNNNRG
jgi:hypothetical protein